MWITISESYRHSVRVSESDINACVPIVVIIVVIVVVVVFEITVVGRVFITVVVIYFCACVNHAIGVGHGFCSFVGRLSLWFLCCVLAIV